MAAAVVMGRFGGWGGVEKGSCAGSRRRIAAVMSMFIQGQAKGQPAGGGRWTGLLKGPASRDLEARHPVWGYPAQRATARHSSLSRLSSLVSIHHSHSIHTHPSITLTHLFTLTQSIHFSLTTH